MLGLFSQCSHPYFHPSVSVSHCLRSPPAPSFSVIFSIDTHTLRESCYVIVSCMHGGNTMIRLSDSHLMTSKRQHTSLPLSFPHAHTQMHTPYCSHVFPAPDVQYEIVLDALKASTGRYLPSSAFPPAVFLPVDITSSLNTFHNALEGHRSSNKLCSLD